MASVFHRSKQRRAERAPVMASGNINLVPLVDILTSIVFFSLLTYQGATMAALTAFDLTLPPVVVNTPEQLSRIKSEKDVLNLLLAVRVDNDKLTVEHSEEGGFHQVIPRLEKSVARPAAGAHNKASLLVSAEHQCYGDPRGRGELREPRPLARSKLKLAHFTGSRSPPRRAAPRRAPNS